MGDSLNNIVAIMASIIARSWALSNPSRSANLSTTAAVRFDQTRDPNIPETYYKHKEKQKAFRVETGEMIYLKQADGGRGKRMLFAFTILLTAYGLLESGKFFYIKGFPEKK